MSDAIYVIPDIHGHSDKLRDALALIEAEGGQGARVIFLGDLVDRGPDSRGVIQTLIDGIAAGRDWIVLRGNHDQLFLDFLDVQGEKAGNHGWLSTNMGGRETLASYGVYRRDRDAALRAVPQAHVDLLAGLPHAHETDDLFLCHAGIAPGVPLTDQHPEDLMWIREPFLSDRRDHGKLIVHGHTPVDWPEHHGNRVALDGGAGWGRALHVAVFEGQEAWLLQAGGRVPLRPGR